MTSNSKADAAISAGFLAVFLILAGCAASDPQSRRERLVSSCIASGGNPIDCASAGETTIPRIGK